MEAILILVVVVLSWVLYQNTQKLNEVEQNETFNSILLRTIVKVLNEKETLTKNDLVRAEKSIKRLREDFSSDRFEDKIEYFD